MYISQVKSEEECCVILEKNESTQNRRNEQKYIKMNMLKN